MYDPLADDNDAPWPSKSDVDVHSGLHPVDVFELRRRVRSVGPDPLAQPTHQIFRTQAQLQLAINGVKHLMSRCQALIVIAVEIAAGRIVTDDGYPTPPELDGMREGSSTLPAEAKGLTAEQARVMVGLMTGGMLWLDWPKLEDGSVTPLESEYRTVHVQQPADDGSPY